MEVQEHDIPKNGRIRFESNGKVEFCYIEWEQDGMSMSVCDYGSCQQQALDKALIRKQRMLST